MGNLFGTDGVRGVANVDLSVELAMSLGQAAGRFLASAWKGSAERRPPVLVGRDTRRSGPMLEAALCAGLASVGVDVLQAGVLPTPAVAYLTRRWGLLGGAVISASHNPVEDNGIKFFSSAGFKLTEEEEAAIEALLDNPSAGQRERPSGAGIGDVRSTGDGVAVYRDFLLSTVTGDFQGWRIVLDCAHGAASTVAPEVFRALGCDVIVLNAQPDGLNINVRCGSTHPEGLQEAVVRYGARVGFAFDGDADRVIAVDERGAVVDGDGLLAICGTYLLERGRLPGRAVAATVYSNLGLTEALRRAGGTVVTTKAGDRFVLQAMQERGLSLGGEQSGHIIFLEYTTTGDGIVSALQLLEVMAARRVPLSQLATCMSRFPQVLENVPIAGSREVREAIVASPEVQQAVAKAQALLQPLGRIVIRPSGTEPVVRVMGEGRDTARVRQAVEEVVSALHRIQQAPGLSSRR